MDRARQPPFNRPDVVNASLRLASRYWFFLPLTRGSPTSPPVSLSLTLWFLASALTVCVFAGWRGARPTDFLRPRMVPWRFIMLLAGAAIFLLLVHLGALMGFTRAS